MFLAIDGSSLQRRLAIWGLGFAVAVLPCVLTAADGRGLLATQAFGVALVLGLLATALSLRLHAWWMKALLIAVALVVTSGILSVVAWAPDETEGKWRWAWLTASALLCVSVIGLEALTGVIQGLRPRGGGPEWASGPAMAPGLTLRRIASWGALLGGLALLAFILWRDYQQTASSVYWGARGAGLLGLPTLLWPEVPLLVALTFVLGGVVGLVLGGLAWGLLRGVSRILGAPAIPPDEPLPPPA